MKLVIFPVVFQLQNYRDDANRIVYDVRIFIPESLILKLEPECHNKNIPYSDRLLLFIFLSILGNCQKNSSVQQMAAVASDMASAAYTPATPIKCGSINANGISRITLRSNAMKMDILACPNATNIF